MDSRGPRSQDLESVAEALSRTADRIANLLEEWERVKQIADASARAATCEAQSGDDDRAPTAAF